MSARRLGLIANTSKPAAREMARQVAREFQRHNITVEYDADTAAFVGAASGPSLMELAQSSEILVVLGGDGTILEVLHQLADNATPIMGINLGTLGFLTCAPAGEWLRAVEAVVAQRFHVSNRTLLACELQRASGLIEPPQFALNDAVISRGELSRIIRLEVRVGGSELSQYNADGLIIATPTGSTAYSLSAGGPVLTPDSGAFVITPICPHVLTMRPVLVSDESLIEIAPVPGEETVFLTLDGQASIPIVPGERLRIRKAAHLLPLALLPGMDFFEVLRAKLKWSGTAV